MSAQEKIVRHLAPLRSATLTVADAQRIAGVTYTPAWWALNALVRAGVLTTNASTMPHPYHYTAKEPQQ